MTVTADVLTILLLLGAAVVGVYEAWRARGLGWVAVALLALGLLVHSVAVRVVS